MTELLKQDKFKFTDNDHILIDRRHAPYPKDLDTAISDFVGTKNCVTSICWKS